MKLVSTGQKVVKIRPAFGSIRHVMVEGAAMYREAMRQDVVFELPRDERAWDL